MSVTPCSPSGRHGFFMASSRSLISERLERDKPLGKMGKKKSRREYQRAKASPSRNSGTVTRAFPVSSTPPRASLALPSLQGFLPEWSFHPDGRRRNPRGGGTCTLMFTWKAMLTGATCLFGNMGGVRFRRLTSTAELRSVIQCGVHRRNAAQPLRLFLFIVQHVQEAVSAVLTLLPCSSRAMRCLSSGYRNLIIRLEGESPSPPAAWQPRAPGFHGAFHHSAGIGASSIVSREGLFRFRHIRLRGVQPRVHGPSPRHPEHQFRLLFPLWRRSCTSLMAFRGFRLFRGYIQASLFQPSPRVRQACTVFNALCPAGAFSSGRFLPRWKRGCTLSTFPGNAGESIVRWEGPSTMPRKW